MMSKKKKRNKQTLKILPYPSHYHLAFNLIIVTKTSKNLPYDLKSLPKHFQVVPYYNNNDVTVKHRSSLSKPICLTTELNF